MIPEKGTVGDFKRAILALPFRMHKEHIEEVGKVYESKGVCCAALSWLPVRAGTLLGEIGVYCVFDDSKGNLTLASYDYDYKTQRGKIDYVTGIVSGLPINMCDCVFNVTYYFNSMHKFDALFNANEFRHYVGTMIGKRIRVGR